MGLKGNGTYNREDSLFARSFDNSIERDAAIKKEIIHRINLLGSRGICELAQKKTQRCFGDGTFGLSDFLDDVPREQNLLHEIVTYNGKYYPIYKSFCHSTFLSIMILMFLHSITSIKNVGNSTSTDLVLKLSFIGLWVFLMIWESTARYFSNYISIMFILAIMGCKHLEQCGWKKQLKSWSKSIFFRL